ncbi:RNA polymerase sigma factor [Spiribacter halobius]|uniref:RNA polymerase sigma-70 region 2 domain-containing protein n=1 Tax=Sediminicurvatus halobius TaxID=2182432 RepID=A0A2U2N3S7_9GAMM|nr:sigma-70 family RNA polymerase sigma factor [Spiribacter halobius]PWG63688.1 hypothetical protein DEM34_07360 [Spiribacter halobius]UEX79826.1 sigma-70 family RNA polymerase sigma factor [Spiribacter halobius]
MPTPPTPDGHAQRMDGGHAGDESDAALMAALRHGRPHERQRALASLYRRHAAGLRERYRRQGVSAAEADDWTHDTFLRLIRHAHEVRDPARIGAWLRTTARRVMIDALRLRRHQQPLADDVIERLADPQLSIPEQVAQEEHGARIRLALVRFARAHPDRARCLIWAALDGLAMAEIGARLGRTPGAAREYVSQSRKKLRPFVRDCSSD